MKTLLLVVSLLLAGIAAGAAPAAAPGEVLTFSNPRGWQVNQSSDRITTRDGSLEVSLQVASSTIKGKMYYKVTFRTTGSSPVPFSGRVSDSRPTNGHFLQRATPDKPVLWSEQLPGGLTKVYVFVKRQSGK